MTTNLAILEGQAGRESRPNAELRAARAYLHELSLRVDPSQAFSVFDV